MKRRRCVCCPRLFSPRRSDARYCCDAHRVKHWRARRRIARNMANRRKCASASCRKALKLTAPAHARFCCNGCRQRAHRERQKNVGTTAPVKAHQRIIRERLAAADQQVHAPADIATAEVRLISSAQAKALIKVYEWLGTWPAAVRYCYGIFFGERLGGVEVYGDEYAENLGKWDRFGYTGKIIALKRGACADWTPPNTASKLIRRSMRLLPERYKVITATVDAAAGEIGTIYQACSFDYIGAMSAGRRSAQIRANGKHLSERQVGILAGTSGARALAAMGFDAISVPRKDRYFAFRGSRRERAQNRAAISELIRPYPKRDAVLARNCAPKPDETSRKNQRHDGRPVEIEQL